MAEQKDDETDDLTTYFEEMDSKNGAKSASSSVASKVVPAPSGTKIAKVENPGKVVAESHKAARPIPHVKSKFVAPHLATPACNIFLFLHNLYIETVFYVYQLV